MSDQKAKLPEVAFFPTKAGDKSRVLVTPAVFDQLQKIEVGSALLLAPVSSEQREKIEANGKTSPTHRLVIMPKSTQPFKRGQATFNKMNRPTAAKSEL